jgi:hypothetical protein
MQQFPHPRQLPDLIWQWFLKRFGQWRRSRQIWYSQRRMDVYRALRSPELFDKEVELLGQLVESPYWPALQRYIDIERHATLENGLVLADDLLKVGEAKGDIGRCNKFESDMMMFFTSLQEKRKSKLKKRTMRSRMRRLYNIPHKTCQTFQNSR